MKTRVIAWWSGGITSALACWWAIQVFKDVRVVFQDTKNEDPDTYRFLMDCESLYGQPIERISRLVDDPEYKTIEDIWLKYLNLTTATGSNCSLKLKMEVREAYQNLKTDYAQIFGYDANERKRIVNMRRNYPEINAMAPLVDNGITKAGAVRKFIKFGIEVPNAYKYGFANNNCLETGCVRGGIGYWQKYAIMFPDRFDRMAAREHRYTDVKGEPVTILRDQTKARKGEPIFLKPHPAYPQYQDLSMKEGREPEALIECNGFCSTKD